MKTQLITNFEALYSRYLDWFRERAKKEVIPLEKECFPQFQSFHEDVYETDRLLLNRMYYMIPISPLESLTGKLEIFSFSELNLMEKSKDDISDLRTVEYRVE